MLGTPNSGSLEPFQRIHEGIRLPAVGFLSAETLYTMPSLYELFPFTGDQIFIDSQGKALDVDIYDPANWQKYGWSVFTPRIQNKLRRKFIQANGKEKGKLLYEEHVRKELAFLSVVLKRAKKFHEALWGGDLQEEKKRVSYALLGSDCQPTSYRALLLKKETGWKTLFRTGDRGLNDMLYSFGDSSVTKESLLGEYNGFLVDLARPSRMPSSYEGFVCENHTDLLKSPTYLDNVLHILLEGD
jgi:hypothetical protein